MKPTGFSITVRRTQLNMETQNFERESAKYGEKLAERTARRNGHGGIISVPYECVGRRYERYIDITTGIITLIPKTPEEIP